MVWDGSRVGETLGKARRKAFWLLTAGIAGTSAGSAAPTTGLEIPKQAGIAAADAILMQRIYAAYFEHDPESESMWSIFEEEAPLLLLLGAAAYGGIKLSEGIFAEVMNFLPIIGWGLSAMITGSVTGTLGGLWWWACDKARREETTPVAQLKAVFA